MSLNNTDDANTPTLSPEAPAEGPTVGVHTPGPDGGGSAPPYASVQSVPAVDPPPTGPEGGGGAPPHASVQSDPVVDSPPEAPVIEKASSDEEAGVPPATVVRLTTDEVKAIQMFAEAHSLPQWKSLFFMGLPYVIVLGLLFTPAWQPTQVVLSGYPLASYLGYRFKVANQNSWFRYRNFLSPLVLAITGKSLPLFGRIIICQLAFRDDLTAIQNSNRSAAAFLQNSCWGYKNQTLKKLQWVFLCIDIGNLCLLVFLLFGAAIQSNEDVVEPLRRLNDRLEPQFKEV